MQTLGIGTRGVAPPALERLSRNHRRWNARIVKIEQSMFIDQQIRTAHPVFELLDLGDQSLIMENKRKSTVPVTRHKPLPNQKFPRDLGFPLRK